MVTLKRYQVNVARELIGLIEGGHRFIIVSMPTGSGKTLVEMLSAYYAISRGVWEGLGFRAYKVPL